MDPIYSQSEPREAQRFIQPKYRSFFLNTIPPNSDFTNSIELIGVEKFNDFGLIELQINDFKTWIAAKKESNRWLLTLNELPLLLYKTKNWSQYRVGHIIYYSRHPLSDNEKMKANRFLKEVKNIEKVLDIKVPEVSYFVSQSEKRFM